MIWHKIFLARCLPQAEFCGVLWCVCWVFFFPLLMSARAAQLFLWASGQGKPHIVTLGAFLKGPGGFLSWGKALNLCQRCLSFGNLLQLENLLGAGWALLGSIQPHPLSVSSAPNQNHPAVCLTPKSQQLLPAPVRKTAGNKKKNVMYFSHFSSFYSWFIFILLMLKALSIP